MTELDRILAYAASQVGTAKWHGRCQAFVARCCEAGIGRLLTRPSAKAAAAAFMKSGTAGDLTPPAGAAVYFNGDGAAGKKYGHVALSAGNGIIYDPVATVVKRRLTAAAHNGYLGWGWNGGVMPGGATEKRSGDATTSDVGGSVAVSAPVGVRVITESGVSGRMSQHQDAGLLKNFNGDGLSVLIMCGSTAMAPYIIGDVKVLFPDGIAAATLDFSTVGVEPGRIQDGSAVSVKFDGVPVFYGYVFSTAYTQSGATTVRCFDQLRYLKNRDSFVFTGTYSELVRSIAAKYGLKTGLIEDTQYALPRKIYENALIDILSDAAQCTRIQTGKRYVLFDDYGSLSLRLATRMTADAALGPTTVGAFKKQYSIDDGVYNRVVTAYDDVKTGERRLFTANDAAAQAQWGVLQYYQKVGDGEDPMQTAKNLLAAYNRETVVIEAYHCVGDLSVRGGTRIAFSEDGEAFLDMRCMHATHCFSGGEHYMDLKLRSL